MRDLTLIEALYTEIDNYYLEHERHHAAAHADTAGIARIETKQRVNDQAYFVLCWGQLEAEIDQGLP